MKFAIVVGACLGLLLACPPSGSAADLCQAGGDKEIAASCSASVQKEGYYVIQASAEATADKASPGDLWVDLFINDAKRGHAESVCEDGGLCRVSVVIQMLLKPGKTFKVEAKQGNSRADTRNTRVSVRAVANQGR